MAVVDPDERSAAAGVTGALPLAHRRAAELSRVAECAFFCLAGGLKIIYDLLLYRSFRTLKPPEEK